jgi:hypothetical protein
MAPNFPHPSLGMVLWGSSLILSGLRLRGFHPLWQVVPDHFSLASEDIAGPVTLHLSQVSLRDSVWTFPFWLAATKGILVSFSSSPYCDASVRGVPSPLQECHGSRRSHDEKSHLGILGSTAACAYPRHLAACRALLQRSSLAIHQTA